jgi:hypothetical protein
MYVKPEAARPDGRLVTADSWTGSTCSGSAGYLSVVAIEQRQSIGLGRQAQQALLVRLCSVGTSAR